VSPSGLKLDGGLDVWAEDMTVDGPTDTVSTDGGPPVPAPDAPDAPDAPETTDVRDAPDTPNSPDLPAVGTPDSRPDAAGCSLGGRSARLPCGAELWPGGRVPYRWAGFWSESQRTAVRAAMADWTYLTDNAIQFTEDSASSTAVGLSVGTELKAVAAGAGAGRVLDLNPADAWGLRHNLGHLLGMPDAHQRADRDRYLTVQDWGECGSAGSHRYSYGRCEAEEAVRSRGALAGGVWTV
jgi:hypothetical protein